MDPINDVVTIAPCWNAWKLFGWRHWFAWEHLMAAMREFETELEARPEERGNLEVVAVEHASEQASRRAEEGNALVVFSSPSTPPPSPSISLPLSETSLLPHRHLLPLLCLPLRRDFPLASPCFRRLLLLLCRFRLLHVEPDPDIKASGSCNMNEASI
ncbi:hypothetical protein Fmac_002185 [Flemingia macrophylla]|uniref:Uncharacterized protein n=1 Tax=Flemingia macrophylla TaxID=520843 RepID=A0ABD1NM11_9FABA